MKTTIPGSCRWTARSNTSCGSANRQRPSLGPFGSFGHFRQQTQGTLVHVSGSGRSNSEFDVLSTGLGDGEVAMNNVTVIRLDRGTENVGNDGQFQQMNLPVLISSFPPDCSRLATREPKSSNRRMVQGEHSTRLRFDSDKTFSGGYDWPLWCGPCRVAHSRTLDKAASPISGRGLTSWTGLPEADR